MAELLKAFILGPPRSGTSILHSALAQTLQIRGPGEGHVMPFFIETEERWRAYLARFKEKGVLASRLDYDPFQSLLLEHVRAIFAQHYPAGSWIDKTPGQIGGIPFILAAFPGARIMLTRRTGIEVVSSHVRKFRAPFEPACRLWRRNMEGLVASRNQPQSLTEAVLEVDQFDLANSPEDAGKTIAAHLGRPEAGERLGVFFRDRRVQKSSEHDWSRRLTLAESGWTAGEKGIFIRECGPMMDALGYPM